jgi:3-hydroxyisobutyrate dehydrogenase
VTAAVWDSNDLSQMEALIWHALTEAVGSRKSGFRTPALATAHDNVPGVRTVVLRRADREALLLQCHTDARSGKLDELRANPEVVWHFYGSEQRVQLRIHATATVHVDDVVVREAWAQTDMMARRCYLSMHAPGSEVPEKMTGLPEHLEGKRPEQDESEAGLKNFAVIRTRVKRIHWLFLRSRGNVSARFTYDGSGAFDAAWLAP